MKLSTKLRISFCILILVPALLLSAAVAGVIKISVTSIEQQYNVSGTSATTLANPVALVSKMCESEYNELLESATYSPDNFKDMEYIERMNNELKEKNAYILIFENGNYKYVGKGGNEKVLEALADIDYDNNTSIYFNDNQKLLINNVHYTTSDGTEGIAFVVMHINDILPQVRNLLLDGIIAIIIILIITSGLFVSWTYKTMVSPINKLKLATQNIANGNLDFDMNVYGRDEISELCRDFDAMRQRLKENAEEKVKADAESKELISNISHDLKTPITAIKGYVEGIMDGVADTDEKMDRYIRTVYNKACDMDKLINELTFYSKVDSNKMAYNYTKINVSEYFYCCAEELSLDLGSSGIQLDYENNLEDTVETIADVEQLKRVINNIVNNSVKYMNHDKGRVRIVLKDLGQQFGVDISDNGPGIAKEDLPFVFDRFYRADASRNSSKGGSGIGLSIVKKIIYDHNGTITVESAVGEGTTMHIVLDKYVEIPPLVRRITD